MMRTGKISTGFGGRLTRTGFIVLLLCFSTACWAGQHNAGRSGGFGAPQARPRASQPRSNGGMRPQARPQPRPNSQPQRNYQPQRSYQPQRMGPANARPGQQHLPAWWQTHRGLSPNQQTDALRREPGFRNLPQDQQQRLINRLHSFDGRPAEQQQRMMDRNEMFERLPAERQQEVRGAAQALSHLSPDRQAVIRHSFQQLRGMPPDERQRMLNSAYGSRFSPQERTVLGNMLSIEPYQPQAYQPYFGRP